MTIHALILKESGLKLWGMTNSDRLRRTLEKMQVTSFIDELKNLPDHDSILLLRGDYLYDERLLKNLLKKHDTVLTTSSDAGEKPVAAHAAKRDAEKLIEILKGKEKPEKSSHLFFETPDKLSSTYMQKLRKIDPPYLLQIRDENLNRLEERLFNGSYKGVTDLVTKWLWPKPALIATRFCANAGITPNQVTSLSLLLVLFAGLLFLNGEFAYGLVAAWIMTFLDTVDGKLARVTVNSSPFGNIYDHAIDLISPPLWYLAWGLGLESWQPPFPLSFSSTIWIIFISYIAGRLVEGTFTRLLEPSGIFCWRPVDSWFRLVTGRRNPSMILLTIGLIAGKPDTGLLAVALWSGASSIFLVIRLLMAFYYRYSSGPLRSWFLEVDPDSKNPSLTERCFSGRK